MSSPGWGTSVDLPSDNQHWLQEADLLQEILSDASIWEGWGRSTIRVPVGEGELPTVVSTSEGLPELVPEARTQYALPIPPAIDRRDLPLQIPPPDEDPIVPFWTGGNLPVHWGGPQSLMPTEDEDMGWLTDIYDVVDASLGGVLPGGVPFGTVTPTGGAIGVAQHLVAPQPQQQVVMQQQAPAGHCGGGPSPVYKKVCGEYRWVYPKRRRRKALVTSGDAKGLATLKGIVGVGKTMDTWIATHS